MPVLTQLRQGSLLLHLTFLWRQVVQLSCCSSGDRAAGGVSAFCMAFLACDFSICRSAAPGVAGCAEGQKKLCLPNRCASKGMEYHINRFLLYLQSVRLSLSFRVLGSRQIGCQAQTVPRAISGSLAGPTGWAILFLKQIPDFGLRTSVLPSAEPDICFSCSLPGCGSVLFSSVDSSPEMTTAISDIRLSQMRRPFPPRLLP